MPINERDLLEEIDRVVSNGHVYASKEKARQFFEPLELPEKLASYIRESRGESISRAAQMFGMSANALNGILGGEHISENMLFRLRNALEYALQHPGISVMRDRDDVHLGGWKRRI